MKAAGILRSQKEVIISKWLNLVEEEIPEAKNHKRAALKDDLPDLLDSMVRVMESKDPIIKHHSQAHGLNRNNFREYSLMHVIKEYRFFRAAVFSVLDQKIDLRAHERDSILFVIDKAIEQSCEVFFQLRQKVEVNAREIAEKKAGQLQIEDTYREEFVQSLSHDLNHPLNNLKLCVEMMEKNNTSVYDLNRLLKIMSASIEKAESFLSDLLEVNMLSAKLPIEKQWVNIADMIWNEVELYNLTTTRRINLDLGSNEMVVNVDVKVLARALDNLLDNAMKHGDSTTPISVACFVKGDQFFLKVHNYGPVIPEDQMAYIFHKYYTSTEEVRKGWGIGLALVKGVADAHGGEVKVKSDPDKGTEFSLVLPVE